jgi:hypothetical protein
VKHLRRASESRSQASRPDSIMSRGYCRETFVKTDKGEIVNDRNDRGKLTRGQAKTNDKTFLIYVSCMFTASNICTGARNVKILARTSGTVPVGSHSCNKSSFLPSEQVRNGVVVSFEIVYGRSSCLVWNK